MGYIWARLFNKIRGKAIRSSVISPLSSVLAGSNVINSTMERHSYCGYNCTIVNAEIGSFTSIADNVIIGAASHPYNWISTSPVFYDVKDVLNKKYAFLKYEASEHPTFIGNDVWIGFGALIKPGIKVEDGAVIGMGSVVTKDVGPYSIVAGNPAKEIKKRFDQETINELLTLKWWLFDDNKLSKLGQFIDNPTKFIELANSIK